jgi:uncharacterized phage protein (TIGR02218 family)
MLFPLTNIGDLQFRLLLIRPDFQPDQGRPIEISHRFDTMIGEGRTSIEERRPGRRAMLLSQTCTLCLNGTAADDWRKGVAALGARPVAVPLWVDALAPGQWADRIYDAKKIVGFDPESGDFEIYDGPALPGAVTFPLYAPLLIGRWRERPAAEARTSKFGYVPVTINEASPWECRIRPHTYGVGWDAFPEYEPSLKDVSEFPLELIELAAAREPGLDRTNAAARWKQEAPFKFADRLAIRQALTHFEAMQGALTSWSPVPAWFQPGADTEATPDDYTARFASDTLKLSFLAGHVARSTIGFIQEIDTPSVDQKQPGEFYLYQLKYQHDAANPELFTNCDEPLALPEGSYDPRQVAHQEIRRSLKPQDDKASVSLAYKAGSLADDWLRGRLFGWVLLTVWKCDPDDAAGTRGAPIYTGFVSDVRPNGNNLTLEATLFGRLLKERAPGDTYGRQCNTFVFSARCGLAEAPKRSEGTSAPADLSADGKTLTIHGVTGWGGPAYVDNWFARGLIRTGAGRLRVVVTVVSSAMDSGNLVVKLARPIYADMIAGGGQLVQLVPGCGRQYEADCGDKFGNQINFQGFEFVPDYIEQAAPSAPKTPKK